MRSSGGGAVRRSTYEPFFTDKNGKARHVGGQYDDKTSFIERTSVADVLDWVDGGTINKEGQAPLIDTPELRLVAAVIEDAARILAVATVRPNEHLKRQAMSWVNGAVESAPGFSFAECCAWLRLDDDWLRAKMVALAARNKGIGRRHCTVVRKGGQDRIAV